jgi:outer membrane protein OmpA-like peptidoglycan-associated protein/tetratricopeptide (TPR) repeat protein
MEDVASKPQVHENPMKTSARSFLIVFLVLILHPLFIISLSAQTQPLSTKSKKAEKLFFSAVDAYNRQDYGNALNELQKAIGVDPGFIEAYILSGDIYSDEKQTGEAISSYKKAIAADPEFSPNLYYIVANIELSAGKYQDARTDYETFLTFQRILPDKKEKALGAIRVCDYGLNSMAHPVPFNPSNLGDSINTPNDEYVNAITSDGQRLYFTRLLPRNSQTVNPNASFEEDFYYSERQDSLTWKKARNLGPPINTHGNEGALSISPDGRYLFFAACERADGYGSCDLYWAKRTGNRWADPENLGSVVNSPSWDSQPSFSSDGRTLYFASKRAGGKGSSDIWKTELQPDGQWTPPVNLGDSINTRLEEMAPFIHPDDQTLYFSSRGHPGMGGLDLFYSRKDLSGRWRKPVNLGYPINTYADEITLVVDATGDLAYVSSDKFGGKGKQDIYSFPLYKEAQPVRVTYFKGVVFNKETKKRLEARFELIDLESAKTVVESKSDPGTGEFLVSLATDKNYALNVSKEGYLFYSDNFSLAGESTKTKPFVKDIPLQEIKVGETVILKNIFFDTDKYDLKEESRVELQKLTGLLNRNPTIRIEISGHTDNQGSQEHNLVLSKNRAQAVYDYLVGHGISKERLSYQGYGFSKPIDTNETEQGRANNRRTEFRVVSK